MKLKGRHHPPPPPACHELGSGHGEASEDQRLVDAMHEYLDATKAGRQPNRRELLARHPAIAKELSACLEGLAFIQSAAGRINRSTQLRS